MKNRKGLIIAIIIILILIVLIWYFAFVREKQVNLITLEKAQEITKNILAQDEKKDSIIAFVYPDAIKPGIKIKTWEEDSQELDVENYTYLAWVDRDPGNAFFAHPTQFIYINAQTGEYSIEDKDFWPVIDGDSFEGDFDTSLTYDGKPTSEEYAFDFSPKPYTMERIEELLGEEAQAATVARGGGGNNNFLHIKDPKEEGDYPHKHAALIVSGFGRNDWVFLEGAHLMYQALKDNGYSDDNITFLAPARLNINPKWDRKKREIKIQELDKPEDKEDPGSSKYKFIKSDVVDKLTSPNNIIEALKDYKNDKDKKLSNTDSLFVFMLTHGKPMKFDTGEYVTNRRKMGSHNLLEGNSADMHSQAFTFYLLGYKLQLCELMILMDSCYSGTHEPYLRAAYKPDEIMRMMVAHSTNDETLSFGADYRVPEDREKAAIKDLDFGADETPVEDTNKGDHGGEFSSGFIENMSSGMFVAAYNAAYENDSARKNNMTHPYMWKLGKMDRCVGETPKIVTPQPEEPKDTPPQPESPKDTPPEPEPEPKAEEPKKTTKKIRVLVIQGKNVPIEQFKAYGPDRCDCCNTDHYHARNEKDVTALDGTIFPNSWKRCGYGKVFDLPVKEIEVDIK